MTPTCHLARRRRSNVLEWRKPKFKPLSSKTTKCDYSTKMRSMRNSGMHWFVWIHRAGRRKERMGILGAVVPNKETGRHDALPD